jgi:hypothetical protein
METCPRSPKATVTKYSNLLIGSCFSVDSLFSFQRALDFLEGSVCIDSNSHCPEKFLRFSFFFWDHSNSTNTFSPIAGDGFIGEVLLSVNEYLEKF